jgi:hypothetical protein
MGSVASVSGVQAASILRVKMGVVGELPCIYRFLFQKNGGEKSGGWGPVQASKAVPRDSCETAPIRARECNKEPSTIGVAK